jgi:hypothetical protein
MDGAGGKRSYGPKSSQKPLDKIIKKSPPPPSRSKMIQLRYISGPIGWTGFEFEQKAIHLFGDKHFSNKTNCESRGLKCASVKESFLDTDCQSIDLLFRNIFLSSEKNSFYSDLFIELPYQSQKDINPRITYRENELQQYMFDISNELNRMKSVGESKQYSNIHPLDIRRNEENELEPYYTLKNIMTILNKSKFVVSESYYYFLYDIYELIMNGKLNYFRSKNFLTFHQDLIKELNRLKDARNDDVLYNIYLNDVIKYMEKSKNFYKMKSNIPITYFDAILDSLSKKNITFHGKNISDHIFQYTEKEIQNYIAKNPVEETVHSDNLNSMIKDLYEYLDKLLLIISALIADGFILSKFFQKMKPGPQIILAYFGNAHIQNYRKFFIEELNLKPLPNSIISSDQRCLENPLFGKVFNRWTRGLENQYSVAKEEDIPVAGESRDKKYILEDQKLELIGPKDQRYKYMYNIDDLLGTGNYGQVYLGVNTQTGEKVAIKLFKITEEDSFNKEVNCLRQICQFLKTSDVLCLLDQFIQNQNYYVITPYLENYINLSEYIKNISYNQNDALKIMDKINQIVKNITYIGFVHGDLSIDNIMIHPNTLDVKLIDLGLCKTLEEDNKLSKNKEYFNESEQINLIKLKLMQKLNPENRSQELKLLESKSEVKYY